MLNFIQLSFLLTVISTYAYAGPAGTSGSGGGLIFHQVSAVIGTAEVDKSFGVPKVIFNSHIAEADLNELSAISDEFYFPQVESFSNDVVAVKSINDQTDFTFEKLNIADAVLMASSSEGAVGSFIEAVHGASEVGFVVETDDSYQVPVRTLNVYGEESVEIINFKSL